MALIARNPRSMIMPHRTKTSQQCIDILECARYQRCHRYEQDDPKEHHVPNFEHHECQKDPRKKRQDGC